MDRKTVRKYTAPAIAAGMSPGGQALDEASWVTLVRSWFPELFDTRLRQSNWPAIEVFHEQIREQMGQVTLATVHQRLTHRLQGPEELLGAEPDHPSLSSGKKTVVLARYAGNRRLGSALHLQAFASLGASPGARAYYDALRGRNIGHHAALRQLANRLVGILHGCLKTGTAYSEETAWQHHHQQEVAAAAA